MRTRLATRRPEQHRDQIAAVRSQVQQRLANSFEGLIFAKTHAALIVNRGHPTINFSVTSGAVYIVRNPLDVAISYAHHMGSSIDHTIKLMAQRGTESNMDASAVYEAYGSWSENVLGWTRKVHSAIYIMRYEDMLADPTKAFGGLARHLHQEATAAELALAIERSSFSNVYSRRRSRWASSKGRKLLNGSFARDAPASGRMFSRPNRSEQLSEITASKCNASDICPGISENNITSALGRCLNLRPRRCAAGA